MDDNTESSKFGGHQAGAFGDSIYLKLRGNNVFVVSVKPTLHNTEKKTTTREYVPIPKKRQKIFKTSRKKKKLEIQPQVLKKTLIDKISLVKITQEL